MTDLCGPKDGRVVVDEMVRARSAVRGCGTPFFTVDVHEIRRQHATFRRLFSDAEIYYAMKANSDPSVLRTVADCGAGFEIASAHELDALTSLGLGHRPVIYGTAVKPPHHIHHAAQHGVRRFALDSVEEARKIAVHAPGASVYVRALVDDRDSIFTMSNKFGAACEEIPRIAAGAAALGLDVEGLSFNVGSQASTADAWTRAIEAVGALFAPLAELGLRVRLLNLGGGYPVQYADATGPTLSTVAAAVASAMTALPYQPSTIVMEPGRALVAGAATLTTSVIGRVRRGDRHWLFVDAGAYNSLFEGLSCQGSTRYVIEPRARIAGPLQTFSVAGPTGDGLDIVAEAVRLPAGIEEGDRLVVHGVGAYTMTMGSAFNGFPVPPVLAVDGGRDVTGSPASMEVAS